MKKVIFNLLVKREGQTDSQAWTEKYERNMNETEIEKVENIGRTMVAYFNDTLRMGEVKRVFLGVQILDFKTYLS
jgi:hypothetical protein